MKRRTTVAAAILTVAALGALPSQAATKAKPKPKPIKGSYTLNLVPDPTAEATNEVPGKEGCGLVLPQGQDKHPFTVPAAGTLKVVLDSSDPTGKGLTDWDIHLLDPDGIRTSSAGSTSHEEIIEPFKVKTPVTFWVCNLAGQPKGNVSYTFTYK